MPEYLSPGVYVEEVPSTIKPIVGVSTSTAAFVGVVPDTVQIPEENPDFDPNPDKKDDPNNPRFRAWTFPFPDADLKKAKDEFAALCKKDAKGFAIRPAMPADPTKLKEFRTAREKLALYARRAAAGEMAPEGKPILCTTRIYPKTKSR
jgi:phage tail sheath protein FI